MKRIDKDRTFTNCGTPGYCAPEVMMADVGHNYKADIWSIGILVCEMVGGFLPFQGRTADNPRIIMDTVRKGQLNLPKNMVSGARDLVKLILTDDPSTRPTIEQIKDHVYFSSVDWTEVEARNIRPPFVPMYSPSLTPEHSSIKQHDETFSPQRFDSNQIEITPDGMDFSQGAINYSGYSIKLSATGGTGSLGHRVPHNTKVLGDYHL